jgi:hypothetical protein
VPDRLMTLGHIHPLLAGESAAGLMSVILQTT